MSTGPMEWAHQGLQMKMTELLGYRIRVRWDEDWVSYNIYDLDGFEMKQYRGHEDSLHEIRALVMKYMLEET